MNVCTVRHCYHTVPESVTRVFLCDQCLHELMDALKWLTLYDRELEYRLNPANQPHNNGTSRATGSTPLPLHAKLATLLITGDERNDSLMDVLKNFASSLGVAWNPLETAGSIASRLAKLPYDRLNRRVTGVYKPQICTLVHQCQQTLQPAEERIIVGVCPNPDCGAPLKTKPQATTVTCTQCASVWSVKYLRQQQYERITSSNYVNTAKQLQHIMLYLGVNVKPSTMRSWIHRGKLTPVDAVNRTYRLKDVYQLATGKEVK